MTDKSVEMTEQTENNKPAAMETVEEAIEKAEKAREEASIAGSKDKKPGIFKRWQLRRKENIDRFRKLNTIMLVAFPLIICSVAEIIPAKGIVPYLKFWGEHPTVMIFDIFLASFILILLLSIFKSGWIAMLIQGATYIGLSTAELFKYNTNGNHLILSDMRLMRNLRSLTSFAYIKITPRLVIMYLLVIGFVFLISYLNPRLEMKAMKRVIAGLLCVLPFVAIIMVPGFYNPVYKLFKIDTTAATNDMLLKEKYKNNGFLAFLVQTATESYENRLVEPEKYSKDEVDEIFQNVKADTSGDFNGGNKPNVIYIMSESYADFRVFDQLDIDDKYYANFDKACAEGHSGTLVTPTYASWTVRSEFELMFGLPVKALNDPNMPQRELEDRAQPSFAQYYDSWGYETAYVHPFTKTFYSRDLVYGNFGFKKLMFHDKDTGESDFTVPVNYYKDYDGNDIYVDDATIFNQLLDLVKTTDDPIYIHTTTMQNHQPYNDSEKPEFENYLTRIQETNTALIEFLHELDKLDEPTLVFFVGDHFPSLRGEDSVYNTLGLNGSNCSILYEQKYFFWSNYDADFSKVPDEEISFFYVPYVIADIINAPHDQFIEKMLQIMKETPVYSTSFEDTIPHNEVLDILTYDRVVGNLYSPSPITD